MTTNIASEIICHVILLNITTVIVPVLSISLFFPDGSSL
jgi:hypothetical protein